MNTEVSSATTRMFVALMQQNDKVRDLVTEVLPQAFPWVRYLPAEDLRVFVLELVEELERADSLDNPVPVAHLLAAWRATAESYADPEYAAARRATGQGPGKVGRALTVEGPGPFTAVPGPESDGVVRQFPHDPVFVPAVRL
ncbi:hypothetical protein FNH05_29330 [Amycolatopsis rhizosphaerae]|uniref:Uncharacterized protein n=1 Tax=Amycolatopsis rhizosphaerae TaxID=2053003 RepID=A0A558B177_9PSEU|nr:hypothetical protein [Amycolatopsis rhizosphaerae]TVT30278.1 hypothetical protein FNH05_29330 [Amycolatopsis rhizosphaerae]